MTDEICVDGIFDAKLVRENKSAKGIFITLEVAADDYYGAKLSDVRPGAVLKIGYREVLNVEVEPIEIGVTPRPLVGSTGEASLANEPGNRGTAGTLPKPKQRFADMPLSQQAGIRCEDEQFWKFLLAEKGYIVNDAVNAGDAVRHICGVKSRSELATNEDAAKKWTALNWEFEGWQITQKYGESIRR